MKGASRSAWLANGAKVKIFLRMEKLQKFGALGCLPLVGIGASTTLSERRLSSLAVQAHSSMRICSGSRRPGIYLIAVVGCI